MKKYTISLFVGVCAIVAVAVVVLGLLGWIRQSEARIIAGQPAIIEANAAAYEVTSRADSDAKDAQFFRDTARWAQIQPWAFMIGGFVAWLINRIEAVKLRGEIGMLRTKLRVIMKGWGK